ncbi:MAG: hypothetical protein LBL34_00335, partial [Clostridiales bacterium]|nr:hypothetical protein [Clostridiales bacterium]
MLKKLLLTLLILSLCPASPSLPTLSPTATNAVSLYNGLFLMAGDWDYDRAPHYTAYGPYGNRDTTNSTYYNTYNIPAWTQNSFALSLHRLTAYPQLRSNGSEWSREQVYYFRDDKIYQVFSNSTTIGVSMSQVYATSSGSSAAFLSSYYSSGGSGTLDDPYALTSNPPPKTTVNGSVPVLSTTAPNPNIPITITANPAASGETKVYQFRVGAGNWAELATTTATSVTYTPTEADLGSVLYFRIDYNSASTHEGVTQAASTSAVSKKSATDASYTPSLPSTTPKVGVGYTVTASGVSTAETRAYQVSNDGGGTSGTWTTFATTTANSATYTPTAADRASSANLKFRIDYSGSTSYTGVTSEATATYHVVQDMTGGGNITGTLQYGEQLAAPADPAGTSTRQWRRTKSGSTTSISGATGTTYILTGDDIGATIHVEFSPASGSNWVGPVSSNATGTVAKRNVTLSPSGYTRAYNGSMSATGLPNPSSAVEVGSAGVTAGSLYSTETLKATISSGTFANANVGDNKAITSAGITWGDGSNGGKIANYNVTLGSPTGNVTKATLGARTAANFLSNFSKVYDGATTLGTLSTDKVLVTTGVNNEVLTAQLTAGTWSTKN